MCCQGKWGSQQFSKQQLGGTSALACSKRLRFPEIPSPLASQEPHPHPLQLSAELCDVDIVFLTALKRSTHTELCKCWMNETNGTDGSYSAIGRPPGTSPG